MRIVGLEGEKASNHIGLAKGWLIHVSARRDGFAPRGGGRMTSASVGLLSP